MEEAKAMEGVKTRAQALAMAKRKMVTHGDDQSELATSAELKRCRLVSEGESVEFATSSARDVEARVSDHVLEGSCCSSNGSNREFEHERIHEGESVEASTSNFDDGYRREKINSSDMSPPPEQNSPPLEMNSPSPKRPSAKEIDEFFAAYEKKQQKHFSEKYNFDFSNEVPLEGRFEWVAIKP